MGCGPKSLCGVFGGLPGPLEVYLSTHSCRILDIMKRALGLLMDSFNYQNARRNLQVIIDSVSAESRGHSWGNY